MRDFVATCVLLPALASATPSLSENQNNRFELTLMRDQVRIASTDSHHDDEDGTNQLVGYLSEGNLGVGGLAWAAVVAFLLGALHALGPGHGKSIAAAYLVGARATVRHALLLGVAVTVSHVASVFVFGLVALWATERLLPEQVTPIIEVAAGATIMLMGIVLLIRRIRHPAHSHEHSHGETASIRAILTLGVTAGLAPCPAAFVVLLTALTIGKLVLGLSLLVVFSLGLAAVLVAVSILVVRARALLDRFDSSGRVMRLLPIASAVVVTLLGTALTARAIFT